MATLVAMATVYEKIQMTFPLKLYSQFLSNFILSIHMVFYTKNSKNGHDHGRYGKNILTTSSLETPDRFG